MHSNRFARARRALLLAAATLAMSLPVTVAARRGRRHETSIEDAPAAWVARTNPFAGQPDAVRAGAKLFDRHCAPCHGHDARGGTHAVDLLIPEVQQARGGSLVWFLRNGNLGAGMPSWSGLPEQRLWQIARYLESR
jgi:mono/diheme cytochrome c family protein